ncbi:hypothetical protein RD792_003654 [Penstemon davidsonii]|uniref:Uncharacterized protein n=1 Tax=Penstemon davidsonii TaxID=160366 RepID=A0ABR0DGG0_9LAMI|nr:hypothetical protein RD792_003654 [Penstemon davidsonii]
MGKESSVKIQGKLLERHQRLSSWNVTKDCNTTSPHCHHGTSPKIVAHGKHLSYLDLSGINFQLSPILAFLGSMTQLRHYYLSGALLSGVVPHDHGNLSSLNVLDLGGAETLDDIPHVVVDDLMWVSHLSLLENLNMSYVDLSPTKDLLVAGFGLHHMLSGKLPKWIGEYLINLRVLRLRENMFYGPIPSEFCKPPNLQILDLAINNLTKRIPHCIGNFSNLVKELLFVPKKSPSDCRGILAR